MAPNARALVWRKVRLVIGLAFGLFAVASTAQINEQDRLTRCENNRARIAQIEAQLPGIWDERRVALAKQMLPTLQRIGRYIDYYQRTIDSAQRSLDVANSYNDATTRSIMAEQARRQMSSARKVQQPYIERFLASARLLRIGCAVVDGGCPARVLAQIDRSIASAEASPGQRAAAEQQIAQSRNNLLALHCGEAVTPTDGPWSGTYREAGPNKPSTLNINGGLSSLSGSFQYRWGTSHNDGSFTGCTRNENGSFTCGFQYVYGDNEKAGPVTGIATVSRSGPCGLAIRWEVKSADLRAVRGGYPYESWGMHPGAVSEGNVVRDGC